MATSAEERGHESPFLLVRIIRTDASVPDQGMNVALCTKECVQRHIHAILPGSRVTGMTERGAQPVNGASGGCPGAHMCQGSALSSGSGAEGAGRGCASTV